MEHPNAAAINRALADGADVCSCPPGSIREGSMVIMRNGEILPRCYLEKRYDLGSLQRISEWPYYKVDRMR